MKNCETTLRINLVFIALVTLAACGKTALKVEHDQLSPTELAQRYAERIQSSDAAEKTVALEKLSEFDAINFDWNHFWQLLRMSPKERLALDDAYLEKLAGIDCRTPTYESFLNFVVDLNYSIKPYIEKAPCKLPKNQNLLGKILKAIDKQNVDSDFNENKNLLTTLLSQALALTLKDFPEADFKIFESSFSAEFWGNCFDTLSTQPTELKNFLLELKRAELNQIPYSSHRLQKSFAQHFIPGSSFSSETLFAWTYLLGLSSAIKVPLHSAAQADLFWQSLYQAWLQQWQKAQSENCSESCLNRNLEILPLIRSLLSRFNSTMSLRLQLKWHEDLNEPLKA